LKGKFKSRGGCETLKGRNSMTKRISFLNVVLFFVILSCGCGLTNKSPSDIALMKKSPSEVVRACYMAANKGEYSDAQKYFSSELLNSLKGVGTKNMLDKVTRNGTIDTLEILSEQVRGEGAIVYLKIRFKDGNTVNAKDSLVKENGDWKVTFG